MWRLLSDDVRKPHRPIGCQQEGVQPQEGVLFRRNASCSESINVTYVTLRPFRLDSNHGEPGTRPLRFFTLTYTCQCVIHLAHVASSRKPDFAATLKRTRKELGRLRRDRDALDTQITKLEQIEAALQGVAEPRRKAANLASITDVVRTAIQAARQPITPTELRDEVLAMGFDKRKYTQFLASLHVILKRLVKNGEVREFTFADAKRYWWALKSMPPGRLPENAMLGNYYNSYKDSDLKSSLTYEEAKEKEAEKYRR